MKLRRLVTVCVALLLVLGSFTCAYGTKDDPNISIYINVTVVDEEGNPAEGVIMDLYAPGYSAWSETTDADGQVAYWVPPGDTYELREMGYENDGTVYNKLSFRITWKLKKEEFKGNAEYELDEAGTIIWTKGDYERRSIIKVEVDENRFNGSRVELINAAGNCVESWNLKEEGELVANVAPGSYTLREIIELNGYEIPVNSHIMVGCGTLVPVKPPEVPEPEWPSYYYDEFQKWIDGLK